MKPAFSHASLTESRSIYKPPVTLSLVSICCSVAEIKAQCLPSNQDTASMEHAEMQKLIALSKYVF